MDKSHTPMRRPWCLCRSLSHFRHITDIATGGMTHQGNRIVCGERAKFDGILGILHIVRERYRTCEERIGALHPCHSERRNTSWKKKKRHLFGRRKCHRPWPKGKRQRQREQSTPPTDTSATTSGIKPTSSSLFFARQSAPSWYLADIMMDVDTWH